MEGTLGGLEDGDVMDGGRMDWEGSREEEWMNIMDVRQTWEGRRAERYVNEVKEGES